MKNSRIVIVDDELSIRKGLSDWLSHEYEICSFQSAEEFILAINDFQFEDNVPTCILLDFQMPEMNGVELQTNLKILNVEYPIIFMSGNAKQIDIIDAWRGGAANFILKPFTGAQISEALLQLFEQAKKMKLANPPLMTEKHPIDIPISKREAEVLLSLGKGLRQNEVAEKLGITLRTVKMHRASLKNKLNLNTLVELTRYCDTHQPSIEIVIRGK